MKKIVLASSSKTRQDVMKMFGLDYEIIKSTREEFSLAKNPKQYVMDLSLDKAESVTEQVKDKAIIIAADTVINMDGKIFEKPKSKEQAFNNIKSMIGKTTYLTTGVTIKDLYQDKQIQFSYETKVKFKDSISDDEINWYINNESDLFNRAGYVVLGKGILFIESIDGDYTNIYGLPMHEICKKLKELGYSMNDFNLKIK